MLAARAVTIRALSAVYKALTESDAAARFLTLSLRLSAALFPRTLLYVHYFIFTFTYAGRVSIMHLSISLEQPHG